MVARTAHRGGSERGKGMDPHGPTHEADAAHLASFGYRQELRRVLGLFENFAVEIGRAHV